MHKKLLRLSLLLPLISIFFYYVWAPLIFLQWCFDMCCDWAIKWQIVIRHVGGLLWSHLCCDTVSCWQGCPHMLAVCPWPAGSSRRSTRSPPGPDWSTTPGSPASTRNIQIILNNIQFSGNFFYGKNWVKILNVRHDDQNHSFRFKIFVMLFSVISLTVLAWPRDGLAGVLRSTKWEMWDDVVHMRWCCTHWTLYSLLPITGRQPGCPLST